MQEAASQIRGSFHQFEEAHKVVIVDRCEGLDGKLDLRGIADFLSELLHLAGRKDGAESSFFSLQLKTSQDHFKERKCPS